MSAAVMLSRIVNLVTLALCLSSVLAAPKFPSQDPFYVQPRNVSLYKPGEVIRTRTLPPQLSGFLSSNTSEFVKAVYQYLYRSTDSQSRPIAVVTTLIVPHNADPTKLVGYQSAYDSANPDCSPSYSLQTGANNTATTDIVFISAALNKGWYVVSPDFEGSEARYVDGVLAGYTTLDSFRAVFHEADTNGLSPNAKYAMWGYSGGSLASEWAAELQSSYAPELHFEGTALGGLTPNISNVLLTINNGSFAGLAFSGIYGLTKSFANLSEYVNQHLIPEKRDMFFSIANGCLEQTAQAGSGQDLFTYFDNSHTALYDPVPVSVLKATGQMGTHGVPRMPLFVYKAVGDEVSPVGDTDRLVDTLCGKGATIEYHRDAVGEHVSEAIAGSSSALAWVEARLNGVPVANLGKCVTQNVTLTSIDPATGVAASTLLLSLLEDLLGGRLGPLLRISG